MGDLELMDAVPEHRSSAWVTGAAGFIGGEIARALLSQGWSSVVGVDREPSQLANPRYTHVVTDLALDGSISEELTRSRPPSVIYHFAGQASAEISMLDPERDIRDNILATRNLLNIPGVETNSIFVFSSSMAVYGETSLSGALESDECDPVSRYGENKLLAEEMIRGRVAQSRILRLFNVYGEAQALGNMSQGMLRIYLAQYLLDGRIKVKGSLDRVRDFVSVEDVVRASIKLADCKLATETVNVCSGAPTTVQQLIHHIEDRFGLPAEIERLPSTLGDIFTSVGSAEKLGTYLDSPPIAPETGIRALLSKK